MEDAFLNPNPSDQVVKDPLSGEEYIYSRYGNPIVTTAEEQIASLEGGEAGLVFSSGMAAITATLFSFIGKGDHLISTRELYGQTYSLMKNELPRLGVDVSFVSVDKLQSLPGLIKQNTRMIYLESITNPVLRVADLQYAAEVAKERGLMCVVDSTFASPYNQNPLKLGADIVVHSATKYLNGHNDLIAGAVVSNHVSIKKIRDWRIKTGGSLDPLGAFLLVRGMKTLGIRVERQNKNSKELAKFLEESNGVNRVYYPGLESHPDHSLATKMLKGFGGVVSFEVKGGDEQAKKLVNNLRLGLNAPSLGGVQTLVTIPRETSHHPRTGVTEEELRLLGINPGLIRVAVGIEDVVDLENDFNQALKTLL